MSRRDSGRGRDDGNPGRGVMLEGKLLLLQQRWQCWWRWAWYTLDYQEMCLKASHTGLIGLITAVISLERRNRIIFVIIVWESLQMKMGTPFKCHHKLFKYRPRSLFYDQGYVCIYMRMYADQHELLRFELASVNDGRSPIAVSVRGLFKTKASHSTQLQARSVFLL